MHPLDSVYNVNFTTRICRFEDSKISAEIQDSRIRSPEIKLRQTSGAVHNRRHYCRSSCEVFIGVLSADHRQCGSHSERNLLILKSLGDNLAQKPLNSLVAKWRTGRSVISAVLWIRLDGALFRFKPSLRFLAASDSHLHSPPGQTNSSNLKPSLERSGD